MEEKKEIISLLTAKQLIEHELNALIYGTIEIRETNANKYIYVHYREEGIALTKYVGEYSDELYNLILNNNTKSKVLKKQIKDIEKKLKNLNYIEAELEEIMNKEIDVVEKAIELLLYIMKRQIFIDGNKRTAVIFINHYLVSNGKGIIVISSELTDEFKELLVNYYEGHDEEVIKNFIKSKCYLKI